MDIRLAEISLTDTSNLQLIEQLEAIRLDETDLSASVRSEAILNELFRFVRYPEVEKLIFDSNGKSMIIANNDEDVTEQQKLKLYPNPTNGETITLELLEEVSNPTIKVYNAMGQLMVSQQFDEDVQITSIDPSDLDSGVYFVELQSKGQTIDRTKFVVKK